jgi:DNA-binding NtrC family response regulator
MLSKDNSNTIFQLAVDLVNDTTQHIFLTGKAGTGKTTFLKYIKEHTDKNAVIVAPTGVAAINAGGVTMHSFFQLPRGVFVPGSAPRDGFIGFADVTDRHSLFKSDSYCRSLSS